MAIRVGNWGRALRTTQTSQDVARERRVVPTPASTVEAHAPTAEALRVWQEAVELAHAICDQIGSLPHDDPGATGVQARYAAVAMASSLAEAQTVDDRTAYREHLYAALASLAELETRLVLAQQRGSEPTGTVMEQVGQQRVILHQLMKEA